MRTSAILPAAKLSSSITQREATRPAELRYDIFRNYEVLMIVLAPVLYWLAQAAVVP
jgi:hypothetical protein